MKALLNVYSRSLMEVHLIHDEKRRRVYVLVGSAGRTFSAP